MLRCIARSRGAAFVVGRARFSWCDGGVKGAACMTEVDFSNPVFQEMPESRAILDFLRTLSLVWSDIDRDLTDPEWTAFRELAKKGAVEGVLRFTLVYGDPPQTVAEYFCVQGDHTSVEAGDPIPAGAAVDVRLVRARLTGSGKRWADYLASESRGDAVRTRGAVLTLLWNAATAQGSMTKVPPPSGATVLKLDAPARSESPGAAVAETVPPEGPPEKSDEKDEKSPRARWPLERTEMAVRNYLQQHKATYRRLGQACLDGRPEAATEFRNLFGPTAIARGISQGLGITDPAAKCRKQDVGRTRTYQAFIRPLMGTPPQRPEAWVAPNETDTGLQDILDDIQGDKEP